ncbi:sulfide quinone reductase-like protein [Monoraphidium neglectum]|uniref:Sulfide:quinone oxidoreductase, mitochondrial n=1 Tax=Monoraphidium neglectum TaxID=145388 RepID=A0A0D2M940_9CHLO|nr:sulfide quinone reductase-like protein [Monoraphidium neglectum]KIY99789.1 sulfide quinone reductase-like protein [Monoraphidium neglectum]|eukprot:XP_013898809.1 sulfide quinone reductase-like protein [Monoraphidium neglectum]
MPRGADWIQGHVAEFDPHDNSVTLTDSRKLEYEYLVVATGLQIKWDNVKGLSAALGDGRVVSNMSYATAPLTFQALQELRSGHALFTMPKGVVKCPGAGHKVCYIAEDYLRREGRRGHVSVTLAMAADRMFGIPRYSQTIEGLVKERDINVKLTTNLVEIRGDKQEAVFEQLDQSGQVVGHQAMQYDFLHVTPPQGPLDVVAHSPIANKEGWVETDPETLQHTRYANVFGIGDCAAVPTSKTAAAAGAQFLVLRDNLDALMAGRASDDARYDGYSSCPLVTKKGACMMMEFGYDGKIMETFTPLGIVDQQKEEPLMWFVKKDVLPWAYWNFMSKGYVPWSECKNIIKRMTAVTDAPAAVKSTR